MMQIARQKCWLLIESFADREGDIFQREKGSLCIGDGHCAGYAFGFTARNFLIFASMEAAILAALLRRVFIVAGPAALALS
jgi:hypothetical protein